MRVAAGLGLALGSALLLNWGWILQHGAARALPALSPRRPVAGLRLLFGNRRWTFGFASGLLGWGFYVAALTLAPLGLVQASSAGGIGLLAILARRRGEARSRADVAAVGLAVVGLALVGVSLAGGASAGSTPAPAALGVWLLVSLVAAAAVRRLSAGVAAGTLYAAGDVATKTAVHGGAWLGLLPVVLAAHGGAFIALQTGFQRAGALATAGVASLLTNALPIAAAVAVLHERLPAGPLGVVRVVSFIFVVAAAAMLARFSEPGGSPA